MQRQITILSICLLALLIVSCSQQNSEQISEQKQESWDATTPSTNVVRAKSSNDEASLKLQLKPGDRFPLRKVVEQELIQDSQVGDGQKIATRLELLFAIAVIDRVEGESQQRMSDQVASRSFPAGSTKLQVRYEQVKYQERVGNQITAFDSTRQNKQIPTSFLAYRDMVGDGFSFWLGPENQIIAVEGFKEFIERCLRNVPESERHQVALGVEAGSGESGIANFIDNSIGLLPYGGRYSPGDTWERPTHIGRPVPLIVNNQYTLKHLTKDSAMIDIRGDIVPSTTMSSTDATTGIRVTVQGGETQGTCTVFRDTGLPQRSKVEQNLDMTVMMSGAKPFQQRKKITTTIEAFPLPSSSTPLKIQLGHGEVIPTSVTPSQPHSPQAIRPVSGP